MEILERRDNQCRNCHVVNGDPYLSRQVLARQRFLMHILTE